MVLGILNLHFQLEYCISLKEKRSFVKALTTRIHREFNVCAVEMAMQDSLREAIISCAAISNGKEIIEKTFSQISHYVEIHFPEQTLLEVSIEYF